MFKRFLKFLYKFLGGGKIKPVQRIVSPVRSNSIVVSQSGRNISTPVASRYKQPTSETYYKTHSSSYDNDYGGSSCGDYGGSSCGDYGGGSCGSSSSSDD